jgi:hypothetical protein
LKPYSIIIQKSWPITFSEFEQQRIDSTDNSFIIKMDLDQLTYGNIIINFFPILIQQHGKEMDLGYRLKCVMFSSLVMGLSVIMHKELF